VILYELFQTENNDIYQTLEISNGNRHYDFLRSIVIASLESNSCFLSQQIIRALNFHAIVCLHTNAGEYRPCPVKVGDYLPPAEYRVQALMDDFVNQVNKYWELTDPVMLATYVLWRLNNIHPFINGNGRTVRAASYFVLCVKSGGWLKGNEILPQLIRKNRGEYVKALKIADKSYIDGNLDLKELHNFLTKLLQEQLSTEDDNNSNNDQPSYN
jgi:fido (protein-threonine AMPylation protein)